MQEVESSVVTATGASPFKEDYLKAARLFTQNHKELHEKGEKWMKDTTSSYIIVSALIITIMFVAAFTVPGGNNQETGFPVFLNEKLFMVFIVSDAISLFSSATSALMFLCILTSRYAEDDFLKSLPTKMIIGISTLFISVATMMVAYSCAIFLMLRDKLWIITPIFFLVGIPVIFVWMQFPLLVEIFVSTYGRGIFNRKVKRWI
ncbi:ankyrin repeat-containing protein ITN1-like [Malus sylvestris]|uniref:ankyrin repeat-containing protein ITN1-like n=1 Tax=Malus sylvestris TaxID=3752 RepID=UPI0021AB9B15|nr:ankyrin repeat-containing protein ITN1-like [Malus sylvestris]